ncbi:MAG TPA: isoaspartyl peptidase/L-asparaginase [Pyrinomonadaceae bacterium]|nr:isoaspartyl peptidase/L-asparaginase [Pyrinomonadaceae bacterium]
MTTDKSRRRFIGGALAGALGAHLSTELSAATATPRRGARAADDAPTRQAMQPFGFVIHGGAGTILRERMTPERESAIRAKLTEALTAGHAILKRDGAGLDAVVAAITLLEDSPLFNAGKGAVFTAEGTNELDASIMEGRTRKAGAVAGLKRIKNPILLARLVMEQSPHVLMAREGAETFAREKGVELVDPKYFYTEDRWQELQRKKQEERDKEKSATPKKSALLRESSPRVAPPGAAFADEDKFGTVGAVCLDAAGNLSAGTSTGGMTNKRFGRIGDSPVIGAGTYADNQTCAVSCTGDGEYFIRASVAHEVASLMRYAGKSLKEAAETALAEAKTLGGGGGLIAIDRRGNFATPFNTAGMYRGWIGPDGKPTVQIYAE